MTATLFSQRLRHVADADDVQRIVARFQQRNIYIELRGKGKPSLYVTPNERGALVARKSRRAGRVHWLWERYGRLTAADIAELHSLIPAL